MDLKEKLQTLRDGELLDIILYVESLKIEAWEISKTRKLETWFLISVIQNDEDLRDEAWDMLKFIDVSDEQLSRLMKYKEIEVWQILKQRGINNSDLCEIIKKSSRVKVQAWELLKQNYPDKFEISCVISNLLGDLNKKEIFQIIDEAWEMLRAIHLK